MKEANERRVSKTISVFSFIVAVLSLGHFLILVFGIQVARDFDQKDTRFGPRHLSVYINLPFSIVLGIFALLQFFSALMIFLANMKTHTTKTIYYSSLIGMLIAFTIGVYLSIQAQEYSIFTREAKKGSVPLVMRLFWTIQTDAVTSLLFMFPMMLFIFYHKLGKYLALQREEKHLNPQVSRQNKEVFYMCVFVFQALSQIALVFNLYQYSTIQDKVDYKYDNQIDYWTYYLAVGVVVELFAVIMQIKNISKTFLDKKQQVLLAVLNALFLMGSFIITLIQTSQFFIEVAVMGDDICEFQDCDENNIFKWEMLAYAIINLITVLCMIPYIKIISTKHEFEEQRDTLLTQEEGIKQ